MTEDLKFVSEIEKICKERSEKWPKFRLDGDYYGEEFFIESFYNTSEASGLNQFLEIGCTSSQLNSALQVACENGDMVVACILMDKGADPINILQNKYFFLDAKNVGITVELVKRTNMELFYKYIEENLSEGSPQYGFSLYLIGQILMSYAVLRSQEKTDNSLVLQNCKKLREDIVFLLDVIHNAKPNPLSGLSIPGDFKFESPLSFHEMFNDQGDRIDSKFARRVKSLIDAGTPMFEY